VPYASNLLGVRGKLRGTGTVKDQYKTFYLVFCCKIDDDISTMNYDS
jgi:hypothetical protein